MAILRVLGFGLFLFILATAMPAVFTELTNASVTFLQSSTQAFSAAGTLAGAAATIPSSLPH